MTIETLLTLIPALRNVPLAPLIAILVLMPLASGVLLFTVRTRFVRRVAVCVTAWFMTAAALLLFVQGATHQAALTYDAPALAGISPDTLIASADFVLLAAFFVLGVQRRSALIAALAVAQLVPIAWFESNFHHATVVHPAIVADWLAITLVLLVSIIGTTVTVYALPYMKHHEEHLHLDKSKRHRLLATMMLFLGAMNALVLTNNLLWMYFFWEVTTLCSFLLIGHDNTGEARANAQRALWMNLLGGVGFAAGIVLLGVNFHTLSVQELLELAPQAHSYGTLLLLPMACLCFAGFTKAAQMPFQSWLLGAMVAPTPVSALLHSSTMVKAGVYLILRFTPLFHGTALSTAVALAGSFTFVAGALLAIGQSNAKRVLAYSTISNLGLIIACAGLNTPLALTAALMLIIFHAISKGLLFMAVGVVEHNIASRDIQDMQGLVTRMPLTTSLMVVGIVSMLLPPFGVLIAKLAAIEASSNVFPVMALMVMGSTLTVMFWTKWIGNLLSAEPSAKRPKMENLHSMYFGPLLLLASGAVLFSLFVIPLLSEVVEPAVKQYFAFLPGNEASQLAQNIRNVPWSIIFGALTLAVLLPLWRRSQHTDKLAGAYFCGEQVETGSGVGFVGTADEAMSLKLGGFYFETLAGEKRHARWLSTVAGVALFAIFAASLLR